jgi:type III restriction enzyme
MIAAFNNDSRMELNSGIVSASVTRNEGIIGEGVNLTLEGLGDMRHSMLLMHLGK